MPSPRPLYLTVFFACASPSARVQSPVQTSPQHDVLSAAYGFADGGHYSYDGAGAPEDILVAGEQIVAADPNGTHCSGFTFAVAMRAARQRNLLAGFTADRLRAFQKEWYGSAGDIERQAGPAMARLGIGGLVSEEGAQSGDFVQFWRGRTGHSAVFLGFVIEGGRKVGLRYRSSQGSTDGISDKTEFFADTPYANGEVLRHRTYFARLSPPR